MQKIAKALGVDVDVLNPTKEERELFEKAANSITDEQKYKIEEKRLSNLIKHKEKMLNISGKQKAVDYMDDLIKIPEYREDTE